MAAGRGRLRAPASCVAAATALALVGAAAAYGVGTHDAHRNREQNKQAAAVVVNRFTARAEALTSSLGIDPVAAPPSSPAVVSVLRLVLATEHVQTLFGRLPPGVEPAQVLQQGRAAMEVARDTGEPRAAEPRSGVVVVAVAEYTGGAPASTADRRRRISSFRLALVDPRQLMSGAVLPARSQGRLVVAGERQVPPTGAYVVSTALVAGQPWKYTLQLPGATIRSAGAVTVLLMSLLGALVVLLLGSRASRALREQQEVAGALERETRTVAELGPLLHSSMDLAQVLPAVAVRLSDEFGLSRIAVQLHGEHGRLVDVFAIGGRSGPVDEELVLSPATELLPASVPASLPLQRAGRTIGRLSLTARRPMQQAQIAALSAAADLIAVATYNVELYEREQASVRRLRDLDQLKDGFLSTISHELRTPITAIAGFVRLLRERWNDVTEEQRLEFLDRVYRNSISLGLLVDDLLDFARLERQALNAPAEPLDLTEHVRLTVAQLSPILGDRDVVTELEPTWALANAGALERVLANLLTNANKFSPAASPIVVRVSAKGDKAFVEVVDEGPGIASEDRDHVFTRFYRGDSSAARGTRGAGIGLSVVRELVTQMGGTVNASANSPHGTRMTVSLSRDPGPPPAPGRHPQHVSAPAKPTRAVRSTR